MTFDTSFTGRLFQVTEALLHGDAVSNQIIASDTLLKGLGFKTAIFSKWHDPEVSSYCQSIDNLDADENDVVCSAAVSNLSCPGRGSSCVSRSQMRGHNLIAELKRLAIKNDFVWFNRRKKQRVAESKVTMPALA